MKPTFDLHGRRTMNTPIWEDYAEDQERKDVKILTWNQGDERNQKI